MRTSYAPTEVDAVAAYCQALDRCFLIPVAAVGGQRQMYLRLEEARNGQRAAVHYAAEFSFGAVAQLEERRHGMAEARGSSPLSSTRAEAVGADQFRNRFGWYMQQAAAGHTFEVSRRGRPFARLGPPGPPAAP